MIDVISWIAVGLVLIAYSQSAKYPKVFDWANVLLFVPVALPAILTEAYSSSAISIFFGIIGGYNLFRRKRLEHE